MAKSYNNFNKVIEKKNLNNFQLIINSFMNKLL